MVSLSSDIPSWVSYSPRKKSSVDLKTASHFKLLLDELIDKGQEKGSLAILLRCGGRYIDKFTENQLINQSIN